MKLSQSLQQADGDENTDTTSITSAKNSAADANRGEVTSRARARVLFVEIAPVDVSAICRGLPTCLCDVIAVDDRDQAVRHVGDSTPDLLICSWEAWCTLGDRVGRTLSAAVAHHPILVLLLRTTKSASPAVDWSDHPQQLRSIRDVIRLISESRGSDGAKALAHADITLDPVTRRVTRGGRPMRLSQTTFQLLHILMAEPERVHTREELLRCLRGEQINVAIRTIDVHVKRLRKELNLLGGPEVIRTVRGVGYAFGDQPDWIR
jgi:Response regulators consisting of a CheY-like receiver domain and a winged-helix DNA-binding domain